MNDYSEDFALRVEADVARMRDTLASRPSGLAADFIAAELLRLEGNLRAVPPDTRDAVARRFGLSADHLQAAFAKLRKAHEEEAGSVRLIDSLEGLGNYWGEFFKALGLRWP